MFAIDSFLAHTILCPDLDVAVELCEEEVAPG